jgi:type IV secretory pathway VirB9-like protein
MFLQFKNKKSIPSIFSVKNGKEFKLIPQIQGSYIKINGTPEQLAVREGDRLICIFNSKKIAKYK